MQPRASSSSLEDLRESICKLVDSFEQSVLRLDVAGFQKSTQWFRDELVRITSDERTDPVKEREVIELFLECGVLQCLERALRNGAKDENIVWAALDAIRVLRKPALSWGQIPLCLLLGFDGITAVVAAASRHVTKPRIRDVALVVLGIIASDEQGTRLLVAARGFRFLFECLALYAGDAGVALSCVQILAQCCIFRLSARAWILITSQQIMLRDPSSRPDAFSDPSRSPSRQTSPLKGGIAGVNGKLGMEGIPSPLEMLLKIGFRHKNRIDILLHVLSILCLVACAKSGAKSLLSLALSDSNLPSNTGEITNTAVHLASETLKICAVRTYQSSVDGSVPQAAPGLVDLPFHALKSGLQRLTNSQPTSPGTSVVTHQERHCSAWALMLLHNLCLEASEDVRLEIVNHIDKHTEDESRELHTRLRNRLDALKIQSSENESEEVDVALSSSNPIDLAADVDDVSFGEGPAFGLLLNLDYLLENGHTGVGLHSVITDVAFRVANELQSKGTVLAPMPLSVPSTRLVAMVFTICSHPHIRERLDDQAFSLLSDSVLSVLQSGDPPEYFNPLSRVLREYLASKDPRMPYIPRRSLPLIVTVLPSVHVETRPSPGGRFPSLGQTKAGAPPATNIAARLSAVQGLLSSPDSNVGFKNYPDGELDFDIFAWRGFPDEICRQITHKMEQLYGLINICHVDDDDGDATNEHVARFLRFHSSLVTSLQCEILKRENLKDRVSLIESIILVADVAAQGELTNVDLTMACLEALHSPAILRLIQTRYSISREQSSRLNRLKAYTQYYQVIQDDFGDERPPNFFIQPRIPYLTGCIRALRTLKGVQTAEELSLRDLSQKRWMILENWLPQTSLNRDWQGFKHNFSLIPAIQMYLGELYKPDVLQKTPDELLHISQAIEPDWSIRLFSFETSLHIQTRIAKVIEDRLPRFDTTTTIEQLSMECRVATKEFLQLENASVLDGGEEILQDIVERTILARHLPRLLADSLGHSREQETQLAMKCDSLASESLDSIGERFGVRENLRLPYKLAVSLVRKWAQRSSETVPSRAIRTVLELKDAVLDDAAALGAKELTADDLIPIFAMVIVLARPVSLCAACHFLNAFYGDDLASGEAAYYLITLQSAIQHICHIQL